jgi:hypothetical protein
VEWEYPWLGQFKADPSRRSFVFTLKNPLNYPARKFVLDADKMESAIYCASTLGPSFSDIVVSNQCNHNSESGTFLGRSYTNDTALSGKYLFTDSDHFTVKEIEVFEIAD